MQGKRGTYVERVAIVTGAGRGIGEVTALALARDGHAVALADLNVAAKRAAPPARFPATTSSLTRSKRGLDRWRCWPASPAVGS